MDADTTSGKDGHRRVLEQFSSGDYRILIGTQMVTKGHHFPRVNLVGVLFGEESLHYPDFRSSEKTFQQLIQVSGRSGRDSNRGEVIVQTYMPEHYVFGYLETHDYDGFMTEELSVRNGLSYPPFSRIILASCSAPKEPLVSTVINAWAARIEPMLANSPVQVLGPVQPVVARIKNRYREQLLIRGQISRQDKARILNAYGEVAERIKGGRGVELRWDVDPEAFL
jgi:primosomal protein N' (replication factor Y)